MRKNTDMPESKKKSKKRNLSVYGKDKDGEMIVLRRNVTEEEAQKICMDYYRKTGMTTVTVKAK